MRYVAGSHAGVTRLAAVFLGLFVLVVAACDKAAMETTMDNVLDDLPAFESGPRDIIGTTWKADTIGDLVVLDTVQSTISFNKSDQLSGKAGCNTFLGPYRLNGGQVTFGPFAMTRMMCEPAAGEQEDAFLMALAMTKTMEVDGDIMWMRDGSGAALLQMSIVE